MRAALSDLICCAQRIPVYYEQGVPDLAHRKFKFTFPRWNQAYGTRVYRNKTLVESDYEINYFKGTVEFDIPLTSYDVINADYNFRWFDDSKLDLFLANGMSYLNAFPPYTRYNLYSIPDPYIPALLYAASRDALRNLMFCLNFQQPKEVFGGSEGAQNAFSNMDSLKKNYEEDLKALIEAKKFGPYRGLTGIIEHQSMSLPGGKGRWFRMLFKGSSL